MGGVVHVADVVDVEIKCMITDSACGRYLVAPNPLVKIADVFDGLHELYPQYPVAKMENMDIAMGVLGKARRVESRVGKEFGMDLIPLSRCLKDAVDSMIEKGMIAPQVSVGA